LNVSRCSSIKNSQTLYVRWPYLIGTFTLLNCGQMFLEVYILLALQVKQLEKPITIERT